MTIRVRRRLSAHGQRRALARRISRARIDTRRMVQRLLSAGRPVR